MKKAEAKRVLAAKVLELKGQYGTAQELLEKAATTLLRVSGARDDAATDDLALAAAACLIAYAEWE